ncbi:MAG: putative dsRNA-binding protein [Cetobacterium sp.]
MTDFSLIFLSVRYTARASVGREQFPEVTGSSKKAAREAAAQAALEELRRRG